MRHLIAIFLLILVIDACTVWGGKKPRYPERSDLKKMYRACEDFEVESPVGKLCNKWCQKAKCKKLKDFKLTVKDFCDPETFYKIRESGKVFIEEDQFL